MQVATPLQALSFIIVLLSNVKNTKTMSVPWINIDSRIKKGIELINTLELEQFNCLLETVINSLNKEPDDCFSPEDVKKIELDLKLDSNAVQFLLKLARHLVQKSWNFVMKPTVLQEDLENGLGLQTAKAESFVRMWTNSAKTTLSDIENNEYLEDTSWQLNLQISSNMQQKQAVVKSVVQFGLESDQNTGESACCVTAELDSKELKNMYNQLEQIQTQLDFMRSYMRT